MNEILTSNLLVKLSQVAFTASDQNSRETMTSSLLPDIALNASAAKASNGTKERIQSQM
jgi:hypothetical protein